MIVTKKILKKLFIVLYFAILVLFLFILLNGLSIMKIPVFKDNDEIIYTKQNFESFDNYYDYVIFTKPETKIGYYELYDYYFKKKDFIKATKIMEIYNQVYKFDDIGYALKSLALLEQGKIQLSKKALIPILNTNLSGLTYLVLGMISVADKNYTSTDFYFSKSIINSNDYNYDYNFFFFYDIYRFNQVMNYIITTKQYEKGIIYFYPMIQNKSNYHFFILPKIDYINYKIKISRINSFFYYSNLKLANTFIEDYNKLARNSYREYLLQKNNIKKMKTGEFLAQIYMAKGDYHKSEKILNEIMEDYEIEYFENLGCSYQALGTLYMMETNYSEGVKKLISAANSSNELSGTQYLAAGGCFIYGDYHCAEEYINKAINLEEHNEYLELKGFILLMNNKSKEANELFNYLSYHQQSIIAIIGKAHITISNKNYNESKFLFNSVLNKSIRLMQNDTSFLFNYSLYTLAPVGLGWTYANQGEHEQALVYYEMVLDLYPTHFLALIGKGNSLNWLGKYEDALKIYNEILRLDPNNQFVYAQLGLLQYNLGNYTVSEELFQNALNLNNETYTCPYEGLGLLYYKQGKFNESKMNLEKSININPDIEYLKYNALAKIYIKEGNMDKARILLKKSIENYPYDDEALLLLNQIG